MGDVLNISANMHKGLNTSVAFFIENGNWIIHGTLLSKLSSLGINLSHIVVPKFSVADQLLWQDSSLGILSFKEVFLHLKPSMPQVPWCKSVWNATIPPSKSFITWRLMHNRLAADKNLQ